MGTQIPVIIIKEILFVNCLKNLKYFTDNYFSAYVIHFLYRNIITFESNNLQTFLHWYIVCILINHINVFTHLDFENETQK